MRSARLVILAAVAACSADPTAIAPRLPDRPSAVLLPASAYSGPTLPFPGVRSGLLDVNDRLQMVGYLEDDAILAELNGLVFKLDKAGASAAEARAVNNAGAAAGWVLNPIFQSPAIWETPTSPPLVRPEFGWVWDMNDRREAVGAIYSTPQYAAYYWEGRTGLFTILPLPPGASWAQAMGINNDRVVVGLSSVGGVMWRQTATGWIVAVLKGIDPFAVDAGYGTVGGFGNQPVWGKPHAAGTLGAGGIANGIHPDGTISGGVATWLYGQLTAFVADRSGNITLLPSPAGAASTEAANSARCGLVVGSSYNYIMNANEAVYWDPGC